MIFYLAKQSINIWLTPEKKREKVTTEKTSKHTPAVLYFFYVKYGAFVFAIHVDGNEGEGSWLVSASLSGEEYPYLLRKLEYWGTTFNNASLKPTKVSQFRLIFIYFFFPFPSTLSNFFLRPTFPFNYSNRIIKSIYLR